MREFLFGNLRVQLLSESIIRLEYAKKGKFCDKNTLLIPDRGAYKNDIKCKTYGNYIIFGNYTVAIPDGARSLSGVKILRDGISVYSYKKLSTCRTLPHPSKTPEVYALADNPRVIVPDGGYEYRGKIKNSGFRTEENVQDIYLLLCGKDCKKLYSLYGELTGREELPLISAFGANKFKTSDIHSARERIKIGAPDEIILDVDLNICEDRIALSELKMTTSLVHSKGTKVIINCTPAPADGFFSPQEVKLRESQIYALLRAGADGFSVNSEKLNIEGLDADLGVYAFSCIAKKYYSKKEENNRAYVYPAGENSCRDIVNYANLLPVIYKSAYEKYLRGEPVYKQLGWEYVQDKRALKVSNEYILGNNILVAEACEGVYLPAGKWLSAYDGKIYTGGKTILRTFEKSPLFIRLGALLPLCNGAKWDKLVYDFYPCKEQSDEGYIYEDDTESTAYAEGKFRTSGYKASYDCLLNAYKIILQPAKGIFENALTERRILFKYHSLSGEGSVRKITVNGADAQYVKTPKNAQTLPLNNSCLSSDSATLTVEFLSEVKKSYEIVVYLL